MHRKQSRTKQWLVALANLLLKLSQPRQTSTSIIRSGIKIVLELAGFGWLTFAGFQVSSVTGAVIAGLSCFVLAWHAGTPDTPAEPLRG